MTPKIASRPEATTAMRVDIVFETHSTTTDNENGIATGWFEGDLSERGEGARA